MTETDPNPFESAPSATISGAPCDLPASPCTYSEANPTVPAQESSHPLVRRSGSYEQRHVHELERYRREVDLPAFAFSFGYRPRQPGAPREDLPDGAVVLRHPATSDELVIWRDPGGVWRYSSTADGLHGQTVVEFLLLRRRLGLGYVRRNLRWWVRENARRSRDRHP